MITLQDSLPYINIAGIGIVSTILWFRQYKSGSKILTDEVVDNYKVLDEQQKDKIAQLQADVLDIRVVMRATEKLLSEKITVLETQVQEKDKYIEQMNIIFQNRNPDLTNILEEIKNFMEKINLGMASNTTMLNHQNILMNDETSRHKEIDHQTKAKKGNVLRK